MAEVTVKLREVQEQVLDCGGLFKDYEKREVQALSVDAQ